MEEVYVLTEDTVVAGGVDTDPNAEQEEVCVKNAEALNAAHTHGLGQGVNGYEASVDHGESKDGVDLTSDVVSFDSVGNRYN